MKNDVLCVQNVYKQQKIEENATRKENIVKDGIHEEKDITNSRKCKRMQKIKQMIQYEQLRTTYKIEENK